MIPLDQLNFEVFLTSHGWMQLLTLTALEVVLGIDNIIMISILSGELPSNLQARARRLGLAFALITRILLLLTLSWMMRLVEPLFSIGSMEFTGKDLVLLTGGLFLVWKAFVEIRNKVELVEEKAGAKHVRTSLAMVVLQIVILDIVFSLDSVITAVGMSNELLIMVLAVVIAVVIMLVAAEWISSFVNRHATVKVLALAFLAMVGVVLVLDGLGLHVDKNYLYAAMGFCVLVEALNLRMKANMEKHENVDRN
ncbi:MAG: TerC family protein [Flavobacteriales bacterium]|jgi:predicted tellurium resistance membrane protein TerC|nr:TerC family protein [Flavobacteriales bacterium]MCI1754127.1 TerC family protein [Flavobacteriales bacterium]